MGCLGGGGTSPGLGRAGKGLLEVKMSVEEDLWVRGFVSRSEDEPRGPFLEAP